MQRARPDAPPLFDASDDAPRSSVKNRARSIARLLRHASSLPKPALKGQRRALRKLQARVTEKSLQARERRYAERYKAVRFFERQKAARRLRRAEGGGDAEAVRRCREDLAYVTWFPRHLRYVALFATKRSSADPRLVTRRDALRAWALANAAAGTHLLQPPSAASEAAGGDTDSEEGEEEEEEEEKEGVEEEETEEEKEDGEKEEEGTQGKTAGGKERGKKRRRLADTAAAAAADPAPAAATAFRLPARPAPPAPPRSRLGAALVSGDDVDELADGALPAGATEEDVRALLGGDTFFSGPLPAGSAALPVFVEEAPEAGEGVPWGGGAWRSGGGALGRRPVAGAPNAAARYEREHMHAPRYRDVAALRDAAAPRLGGTGAGTGGWRPLPPPPPQQQQQPQRQQRPQPQAPNLSELSGRKRKRAERALAHASRAGDGGMGRFTESSFGTSADPLARLKSADRLARAAKKDAGGGGGGWGGRGGSTTAARRTPQPAAAAPMPAARAGGAPPQPAASARKDKKRSVLLRFDE